MNKFVVEFLGTLFFLYVILATNNPLAIGLALAVAIMVGGKISSTTTIESSLLIVPLMPLDPETQRTQMIENPLGIWITFVEGSYDILNGDILVIGSDEYNIRSVATWEIDEETTYQLILEKPKVSA